MFQGFRIQQTDLVKDAPQIAKIVKMEDAWHAMIDFSQIRQAFVYHVVLHAVLASGLLPTAPAAILLHPCRQLAPAYCVSSHA